MPFFLDRNGDVHSRGGGECPAGMLPHDGVLKPGQKFAGPKGVISDGRSVRVPMHMMDSTQRAVALASHRMSDTAGVSRLLTDAARSATLTDALGACPPGTEDIQHKVARHIIDAQGATSDGAFENAIHGLNSMSRQYLARAHLTADAGHKTTLTKASEAVGAYTDGLLASRGKPGSTDVGGGREGYIRRLNNAWKNPA